jgi:hypothetical protein
MPWISTTVYHMVPVARRREYNVGFGVPKGGSTTKAAEKGFEVALNCVANCSLDFEHVLLR